jgi:hypothetical protein
MVDLTVSGVRRKSLNTAAETETAGLAPAIADEAQAEEMHHLVAIAAYYLAERRNFEPGHELADWLAAEAQVFAEVESAKGL